MSDALLDGFFFHRKVFINWTKYSGRTKNKVKGFRLEVCAQIMGRIKWTIPITILHNWDSNELSPSGSSNACLLQINQIKGPHQSNRA